MAGECKDTFNSQRLVLPAGANKFKSVVSRWSHAEAKNLMDSLMADEHPQYQAYKNARAIAARCHVSWLPVGLQEMHLKQLQAVLGNSPMNDRMRLIRNQMPLNEVNLRLASQLQSDEKRVAKNFILRRNRCDLGVGKVSLKRGPGREVGVLCCLQKVKHCPYCVHPLTQRCSRCNHQIGGDELFVSVLDKHSKSRVWCVTCFRCTECEDLLADFVYFWHDDKPWCLRHYGEKIRPRCHACDELILAEEYTKAHERTFHLAHFVCRHCQQSLTEATYAVVGEDSYCLPCYDLKFAPSCHKCQQKILCKDNGLTFQQRAWHETCFRCHLCHISLSGATFMLHEEFPFCTTCYNNNVAARCHACEKVLAPGSRTLDFREKKWHEDCFRCAVCAKPIGLEEFIPGENDTPVCLACHNATIRPRCIKCNKSICGNGLLYKGQPWHSQCFVCGFCKLEIGDKKFTYRQDTPFCAECYGLHLAKKCTGCKKPISGFQGDQYVTVEDHDYHSTCFNCATCSTNLVSTGFIHFKEKYLCPPCAQAQRRGIQVPGGNK